MEPDGQSLHATPLAGDKVTHQNLPGQRMSTAECYKEEHARRSLTSRVKRKEIAKYTADTTAKGRMSRKVGLSYHSFLESPALVQTYRRRKSRERLALRQRHTPLTQQCRRGN